MNPLIEQNRNEILDIAQKHGAYNVRVFGSMARDDYTEESDVDLIVEFEEERDLFDWFHLADDLEELLDRRIDITTDKSVHWYIRDEVLSEAVSL